MYNCGLFLFWVVDLSTITATQISTAQTACDVKPKVDLSLHLLLHPREEWSLPHLPSATPASLYMECVVVLIIQTTSAAWSGLPKAKTWWYTTNIVACRNFTISKGPKVATVLMAFQTSNSDFSWTTCPFQKFLFSTWLLPVPRTELPVCRTAACSGRRSSVWRWNSGSSYRNPASSASLLPHRIPAIPTQSKVSFTFTLWGSRSSVKWTLP